MKYMAGYIYVYTLFIKYFVQGAICIRA